MASIIPTTSDGLEVADYGSDIAYAKVVKNLKGEDNTTPDDWAPLPIRDNFDIAMTTTVNSKTSEGGTKRTTSTTKEAVLKYVTQQVSKVVIQDFPIAVEGLILLVVLELSETRINGKIPYAACLAKLSKRPGLKTKVSPEFEFDMYQAEDDIDIVVDLDTFEKFHIKGAATGTLTILKGEFFGMVEVTTT